MAQRGEAIQSEQRTQLGPRGEVTHLTAMETPWNFSQLALAFIIIHCSIHPIGPDGGWFLEAGRRKPISPPQIGTVISLE
jgi:hypothetical protein